MRRQHLHVMTEDTRPVIHIRFMGQSRDIPLEDLGLEPAAPDGDVRQAVARHLEVAERDLAGHIIERHENGNLTLRPEAVFGR